VTDCPAEASMLVCCTYRAGTFICRHSGGVGECRGGRDPGGDREGARALRPRPEERRAIGGFHHPCRLCGGGARRPPLAGACGVCQIGPFPITARRPPIRVRRYR
jgi:hypothetical protein